MVFKCLKKFIFFYNKFVYYIFQQPDRGEKKAKKTNSGFQSNVRSLFHNLDYKKEKAGGFLVIYTPLCVKKVGISFSSHLYQAGTPWADRSSEVATSLNEIFHVKVCVHAGVCVVLRTSVRVYVCACFHVLYVCVGVSMVVVGDIFQSPLCRFLIVLGSCLPLCTINSIICT